MKSQIIKNIRLTIISFIFGGIIFLSAFTYANSYNSEEISYDNSISHASATTVKDAIDYLYLNGAGQCPEDMTCIESPIVTINASGPGSVNKNSIHVRINGSNKFIVTPDEGYTLNSISCTNGYTLGSFYTSYSSTKEQSSLTQEITINNPGISDGATCTVYFGSYDISISSSKDNCSSPTSGCVCYYIKYKLNDTFNYGSHTNCRFKSTTCKYYSGNKAGSSFSCDKMWYGELVSGGSKYWWYDAQYVSCYAVITCQT